MVRAISQVVRLDVPLKEGSQMVHTQTAILEGVLRLFLGNIVDEIPTHHHRLSQIVLEETKWSQPKCIKSKWLFKLHQESLDWKQFASILELTTADNSKF